MKNTDDMGKTIEYVLRKSLMQLKRMDSYEGYLDYIRSEWYSTTSDLLLALEDGKAWSDLKLPGRLKLEMKTELAGLEASIAQMSCNDATCSSFRTRCTQRDSPRKKWIKFFSVEDNAFFFFDVEAQMTQWEIPTGNVEMEDDSSIASAAVSDRSTKSVNNGADKLSLNREGNNTVTQTQEALTDKAAVDVPSSESNLISSIGRSVSSLSAMNDTDIIIVHDAYASDGAFFEISSSTVDPCRTTVPNFATIESSPVTYDPGSAILMTQRLMDMGFSNIAAIDALKRSGNNISGAASILLNSRQFSLENAPQVAQSKKKNSKFGKGIVNRLGFKVAPPLSAPPLCLRYLER